MFIKGMNSLATFLGVLLVQNVNSAELPEWSYNAPKFRKYRNDFKGCLDSRKSQCLKNYIIFPVDISWPVEPECESKGQKFTQNELYECLQKSKLGNEIKACLFAKVDNKYSAGMRGLTMRCFFRVEDKKWQLDSMFSDE